MENSLKIFQNQGVSVYTAPARDLILGSIEGSNIKPGSRAGYSESIRGNSDRRVSSVGDKVSLQKLIADIEPVEASSLDAGMRTEVRKHVEGLHLQYGAHKNLDYTAKTQLLIDAIKELLQSFELQNHILKVNFGVDEFGVRRPQDAKSGLQDLLKQLAKQDVEVNKLKTIALVFKGFAFAFDFAKQPKQQAISNNPVLSAIVRAF